MREKSTTFSTVYTLTDHENSVKMFKTLQWNSGVNSLINDHRWCTTKWSLPGGGRLQDESNRKYTVYCPGNIPSNRWDTAPSSKYICLVPVWRFPSPSRSIHFGDVSEVNEQEKPSQKQNAHAWVAFLKSRCCKQQKLKNHVNSCGNLRDRLLPTGFEKSSECCWRMLFRRCSPVKIDFCSLNLIISTELSEF